MEFRKLWEIIWRRKWIIIQAFFVISLTAIVGSFLVTPIYETSSKVFVKTSETASSLMSSIGLSNLSSLVGVSSDTEIDNYIELSTLDPILKEVISQLQLRSRDGDLMTPDELRESNIISSIIFPKPNVKVEQVEDTDLIEITVTSPDTKEAAMIGNTLANLFIEENLKQRREEYGSARRFIEGQIKLAKADYLDLLQEIKAFKIAEKTIDISEEIKLAIAKMGDLMKEKEDNIIDISETKARLETLKAQLERGNGQGVSSLAISENPQIEEIKKRLSEFELQLAGMLTEKTQNHPDIISLKNKIVKAREELSKEVGVYQKSSQNLESLERDLAALEVHLKGVNADINKYMSMLYTIPDKAFREAQLTLKLNAKKEIYSSLLEYLYQIGVAEAMTLSDIRLVEHATEPDIDAPKSPNKILNGIVGVFLGLMFGFGIAFLVDYMDDRIRSSDDAKELGLTFLGTVPKFRRKESPLISQRDPRDPITESYRTIRNSLKFISLDKSVNSFLITSSLENEGKSTTVINLAISITREEKQVLIMDTDLRRPSFHEIFGVSNSTGVSSILAEEAKLDDAIKRTDVEGLSVLTSGPIPPDPGRMIESQKMKQLIKDVTQQYDIVILDSPPILIANDSIILTGYVDGCILVLESRKITRRVLTQGLELLKQANIQLTGAVLNKLKIERGGYYYSYYYKSGYYKGKRK